MRDSWLELVDRVLRPARPRLEQCRRVAEELRVTGQFASGERDRALLSCQARIEQARAAVFEAGDGVVPARMTDLEREWRALLRSDPDRGLMDLWARIAPRAWIDRKRWRDSASAARLDAAIALASDVDGVEAAEAAVAALRGSLAAWGVALSPVVRWRVFEADADCVTELLEQPLHAMRDALSERSPRFIERATRIESTVRAAASARFPDRPLLAQSLAHAASVDDSLHAFASLGRPNPVTALRELWNSGYTLSAIGPSAITLEIPPLERRAHDEAPWRALALE